MFETVMEVLRDDPVEGLPRFALHDRFSDVRRLEAALAAYKSRLVSATGQLGDNGLDGAGMLRSVGRMSARAASAAARTADALEGLPAAADALADGRITAEHATALAKAAERVSPEQVDAELVPTADAPPADVFAKRTREWVAANESPRAGEDELARQRRERDYAHWVEDGMWKFLFSLDSVNGARVKAQLDAEIKALWRDDGGREAGGDARTPGQRGADAFVGLADHDRSRRGSGAPPPSAQFNVVVDLERLCDDPSGVAATVADGDALPQSVLELLACNASVTPVLFDGPGRPIWVGRDHRAATLAQWRALIARDRGCVGCGAAPDRCEAHHVVAWLDFGATDITNLVLVCSRCHHDLHDRGSELRRVGDGWEIVARGDPPSGMADRAAALHIDIGRADTGSAAVLEQGVRP